MPELPKKPTCPVRSFVRREGRITPAQSRALESLWPKYGLAPDSPHVDFSQIFARKAPVWLEIGFGNGASLAEMAIQNPNVNFLGVEVYRPGVGALLLKLEREQIDNVKVFSQDANVVLQNCISPASLSKILIFFPDPWPKKRHHKRRLIQLEFLNRLSEKLTTAGNLHIATDWADYAEHILEVASQQSALINQAGERNFPQRPGYRPLTKYEQRGQKLGHEVFDILLTKQ